MKRIMLLSAVIAAVLFTGLLAGCSQGIDPEKQKQFATELLNRRLYAQAAVEYDRYLDLPGVSDEERSRVLFAVANTLMNDARDYDGALIRFLKLRSFYPDHPSSRDIETGIITCFERTGRVLEAQLALEASSALQPSQQPDANAGAVLAQVGSHTITDREFQEQLQMQLRNAPPQARTQLMSLESKRNLLQQMVGGEILYAHAQRAGYESNPDVRQQIEDMTKNILIQKAFQEQIGDSIQVSETEISLYYQAHQQEFRQGQNGQVIPLERVRPQIASYIRQMKQNEAMQALLQRNIAAQDVTMYPERLR